MGSANSITERIIKQASPSKAELLRIWLVDDHDGFRQLLANLLNLAPGIECPRHFSSAEAVLPALQEQSPDAILLDVEMPKMSGVEAIPAIKKLSPSTTVLMLTTFSDDDTKERSLANRAADFLLKHYSLEEMVAAVRAAKSPRAAEPRPS